MGAGNKVKLLNGVRDVGEQGQVTGPLNGSHELALVFRARTGDALRYDLPLFGDESEQSFFVLVVDVNILGVTESACSFLANGIRVSLFAAVIASAAVLALMEHGTFSLENCFVKPGMNSGLLPVDQDLDDDFGDSLCCSKGLLSSCGNFPRLERFLIKLDRQMTNDLFLQMEMALELDQKIPRGLEFEEGIEAVVLLVDGVCEAFSSPLFSRADFPAVLDDDVFHFLDHHIDLRVVKRRVHDES